MDSCDECGFTYELDRFAEVSREVRHGATAMASLLDAPPEELERRAHPEVWSALEYVCHMRDVFLVQRERVLLARREVTPSLVPMGREQRVAHDGYGEQEPAAVARQIQDAALLFSNVLDRLGPDDWDRTLIYNWPEKQERSLRWVAIHTLHELVHHTLDVRRQLV